MCSSVVTDFEAREALVLPFTWGRPIVYEGSSSGTAFRKSSAHAEPCERVNLQTLKCRSEACRGVMTAVIAL